MKLQGIDVRRLAELTGKQIDHVEAVVNGYPNSMQRPTQLDTVDEIAATLGRKLDLNVADKEG
jgi:RNase H-fold protein (predicted Holliday junction resolvase)